jgi:hypothetical protein
MLLSVLRVVITKKLEGKPYLVLRFTRNFRYTGGFSIFTGEFSEFTGGFHTFTGNFSWFTGKLADS